MSEKYTRDRMLQIEAAKVMEKIEVDREPAPDNFEEMVAANPYLRLAVSADVVLDTVSEIGNTTTDPQAALLAVRTVLRMVNELHHMADVIVNAVAYQEDGQVNGEVIRGCDSFAPQEGADGPAEDVVEQLEGLADFVADALNKILGGKGE